jgi:hypothetical protein
VLDLEAMRIKGTCQELEKEYFRWDVRIQTIYDIPLELMKHAYIYAQC